MFQDSIIYLDVRITNKQGTLHTSWFTKPTDRNTLLHYQSAHSKHLRVSLPISQFKRVIRICFDESEINSQLKAMYGKFVERGYPTMTLDKALTRATLNPFKTNKTANRPLFIHGFNQKSDCIRQATTRNINILRADGMLSPSIKNPPLLVHKWSRSLRDILVQADPRSKYAKPKIRISQKKLLLLML